MFSANKTVRIIKRKQFEHLSMEGKVVPLEKTGRQIEREMLQTVASWIDERREIAKEFARSNSANLRHLMGNL